MNEIEKGYYIVEKETGRIWNINTRFYAGSRTYTTYKWKTKGAAKATMTRKGLDPEKYWIIHEDNYVEPVVTRKNLISGEEYEEGVNTPSFCSPSSEAYWSM